MSLIMNTFDGKQIHHNTRPRPRELPRSVYVRVSDMPAGYYVTTHSHDWNQLLYALDGTMTVVTEAGMWIVPPQRAVWVPPHVEHAVTCTGFTRARHLYIGRDVAVDLPDRCMVLEVSPLLRELIRAATKIPIEYDEDGAEGRLIRVMLDQLKAPKNDNLHLPAPKDPRLARICEQLQADPADNRTLDEWSRACGASSRTLARLFQRETGMPFRDWRQKLRLLYALEKLAHDRPVTEVALDLGYESTSAFIAMFRKATGKTPGSYFR
ncbi:AraC family transcriptional regulator [Thalassospira alkalitolerans]|uniref:AraC family transcriptional regulator n=1 Tax=Thalassospira alkalitolerans TaxID=1293890 RepID=UPI000A1EDBB2|nr:helix-turn-helix transcriptional regulator [Thalassospira alkalitolerans]|tara:strand:+ start:97562 stop:98362 length:801 start_codon:yes stop_codon:yes gene_type:complete